MSSQIPPTQFTGKTWIFVVQALVFGGFAGFSLLLGPLFLLGILERADGKPGTEAGVALTIMGVPFLLIAALAIFNIIARRRPILRICREGLAVNMIGSSSLDGTPLLPSLVRVAWLIVSLQGFRQQILLAPWESLRGAGVSGLPMARSLTIAGAMFHAADIHFAQPDQAADQIVFPEVAVNEPLDRIATTVNAYFRNAEFRDRLPSWDA